MPRVAAASVLAGVVLAGCWLGAAVAAAASPVQFTGYVAAEYRGFFNDPLDPVQHGDNLSAVVEPEWYYAWNDDADDFTFVPFLRVDQHDDERTHFDIRELTWTRARAAWELRVGIRKLFWGVTESQHLVDVINQTDLVENPDGEDKLGQPMVNLALIQDWGTLDLFVLPGFRERTFPGREGRLRFQPRVEGDRSLYESSAEEWHVDVALRWSRAIGDWDLGVSHFHGTSRDPRFILDDSDIDDPVLIPFYDQIDQTGLDAQMTRNSWLWKLEAIRRSGQESSFLAATAGFEYTLYGLFESTADLGVVVEYLYDDRPTDARVPFEDDLFAGLRLTLNDVQSTEALAGCIFDLDSSARFCNVEASRRLGEHWLLSIEARSFAKIPESDPLFPLRRDDYLQAELAYYF